MQSTTFAIRTGQQDAIAGDAGVLCAQNLFIKKQPYYPPGRDI